MIKRRHTVSAIALSTLLVLGACGKKDVADQQAVDIGKITVKTADTKLIEKMLDVENRKVANTEADKALAELGLLDAGKSDLNWDSKSGKTGDYQYKNLSFKSDDDKNVKIASLELEGVHMDGENPTFDRMNLSDVTITDDDGRGRIDRLVLSRPHPKMAARVLTALGSLDSLDDLDLDIELEDGELGFGAMLLEGMDVTDDETRVQVDTFGWGADETTGTAAFLAENILVKGQDEDSGSDVTIRLKKASATDLSIDALEGMNGKRGRDFGKSFNPLATGMGNLSVEDLQISAEGVNISAVGMDASSTKRGNVTTEKMVLRPLTIKFDETISDRDLAKAAKTLQDAGFETLELTGQSVKTVDHKSGRVNVSNATLSMKDAFNLSYNLDAIGAIGDDWEREDLEVERMKLSLTDHSIVDKIFNIAADMQGSNPQVIKLQAKAGLTFAATFVKSPDEREVVAQLADAAGKFMDAGGTLTVEINPDQPISMKDVDSMTKNPTKNVDRLGLTISHHP